ncbi:hypothetical protein IMZ48_00920 [Candidatus Bathyarchaeota archaeon]|nr:hypothetical protein [Candidatus Bathyarchaeota archaeon]
MANLGPKPFGKVPLAVAEMAQPTAEPIEDYECVPAPMSPPIQSQSHDPRPIRAENENPGRAGRRRTGPLTDAIACAAMNPYRPTSPWCRTWQQAPLLG